MSLTNFNLKNLAYWSLGAYMLMMVRASDPNKPNISVLKANTAALFGAAAFTTQALANKIFSNYSFANTPHYSLAVGIVSYAIGSKVSNYLTEILNSTCESNLVINKKFECLNYGEQGSLTLIAGVMYTVFLATQIANNTIPTK